MFKKWDTLKHMPEQNVLYIPEGAVCETLYTN